MVNALLAAGAEVDKADSDGRLQMKPWRKENDSKPLRRDRLTEAQTPMQGNSIAFSRWPART